MKAEVFIRDVWFKNCSVNGNPSYFVNMDFDNGLTEYSAYTGSDCACGYGMRQNKGKIFYIRLSDEDEPGSKRE